MLFIRSAVDTEAVQGPSEKKDGILYRNVIAEYHALRLPSGVSSRMDSGFLTN